jgi:regulator of protease activity HflC (stomatin/prohibitin superfamily)
MENFWLCRSFGGQRAFRDLQRWRLRQKRFSIPRRRRSQMIPIPAVVAIIVVLYVLSAIKILREYERGVIFRLGRLLPYAKGPGIILVFAPVDRMARISLRQEALEVKPQDIITRDNVTLKVNAVIFLRVIDPRQAVVEVSDYINQTSQFAQTTLRSVLGEAELDELLAHREKINMRLQSILDAHTARGA